MAKRKYFIVYNNIDCLFIEKECEFQYYSGFSVSQKQKSINELHKAIKIKEMNKYNILEISTKSPNKLGINLSAFNLQIKINNNFYSLECVFQSSKVFLNGGPYLDLLYKTPYEVKKDPRIKESGPLVGFQINQKLYPLNPKTSFYDWLYCNAINSNTDLSKLILNYDCFTDIEFNHEKSINCQARSAAIYVSLVKTNMINDVLKDYEIFTKYVYKKNDIKLKQMQFDFE